MQKFFLFLLMSVAIKGFAQRTNVIIQPLQLVKYKTVVLQNIIKNNQTITPYLTSKPIPSNYYTSCFGFVCKKELQMQKRLKLPIYFRLGSLAYCNKLEGK
jgi:hypothetical protein